MLLEISPLIHFFYICATVFVLNNKNVACIFCIIWHFMLRRSYCRANARSAVNVMSKMTLRNVLQSGNVTYAVRSPRSDSSGYSADECRIYFADAFDSNQYFLRLLPTMSRAARRHVFCLSFAESWRELVNLQTVFFQLAVFIDERFVWEWQLMHMHR